MRYKGIKGNAWQAVKRRTRAKEKHCFTCGARNLEGQNAQAGHFKPVSLVGSNNWWSWNEDFIHLQCGRCNGPGQGMAVEFRANLVLLIGEAKVIEFEENYRRVNPVKNWQEIIDRV